MKGDGTERMFTIFEKKNGSNTGLKRIDIRIRLQ